MSEGVNIQTIAVKCAAPTNPSLSDEGKARGGSRIYGTSGSGLRALAPPCVSSASIFEKSGAPAGRGRSLVHPRHACRPQRAVAGTTVNRQIRSQSPLSGEISAEPRRKRTRALAASWGMQRVKPAAPNLASPARHAVTAIGHRRPDEPCVAARFIAPLCSRPERANGVDQHPDGQRIDVQTVSEPRSQTVLGLKRGDGVLPCRPACRVGNQFVICHRSAARLPAGQNAEEGSRNHLPHLLPLGRSAGRLDCCSFSAVRYRTARRADRE